MFLFFSAVIVGYALQRALSHGGGSAMRRAFFIVVLTAPTWMVYQVRSIRLDFRIVVAAAGIAALIAFTPKKRVVLKLMLTDVWVILLVLGIMISQTLCGQMVLLTPFDIAAQWLATYVAGRFFLQHEDDIDDMIPIIVWVFFLVCCLSLFECVVQRNLVNTLLGKHFALLESGEGYRWGMKRAQGNVVHPIFNGFQLVMLFPWAVEAARRAKQLGLRRFYRWVTWFAAIAAFLSISRGPQISLLITMAAIFFFRHPRFRVAMLVLAVTGGSALIVGKDAVMHALGKMAGEDEENVRIIYIDGEPTEYTGTKHRVLLLRVYKDAIAQAGYFGWGGALEGIELEEDIAQRFGSIDSHYLMFYLQYGYVGITLFGLLMLTVIFYSFRAAWDANNCWCTMAGGICGAFCAMSLLMASVWFAPDYGAVWMFNAGLITNIRSLRKSTDTLQRISPLRRLIPISQNWRAVQSA